MKKPQWIVAVAGILLVAAIFIFGRTVPDKKTVVAETHSEDDGHDHGPAGGAAALTTDSILSFARKQLNSDQLTRISFLENSITRGDVKTQQLNVYHQLSHFWGDSMGFFPAYAWYEAEAARLENSEKSLTFAAHLFLNNLQQEQNPGLRQWEALQAKDLFERSLSINPSNDSSTVGLGATYLFGGIGMPMDGINLIRKVEAADSSNLYAHLTLVKGSILSGQLDKATSRLETVNRLDPNNVEAILLMAEVLERSGKKKEAAQWYEKSLALIKRADVIAEIEKRIALLKK